ncbi:MAG: hypothetical protein C0498_06790 [Anaerolinea sp.]|nr:hypothetical protein [Anaerolinea sp.]
MITRAPLRRGGQLIDEAGLTVTWSVAEGRRGRRWRWAVGERRAAIVVHTLELDPAGRFVRLESASGGGLLTLHREADGSAHGNRVTEAGVDHLAIPSPAPQAALVGSGVLGVAALITTLAPSDGTVSLDVLEVFDDLGLRITSCTIRRPDGGVWEVRTDVAVRLARLDADRLPVDAGESWPLESA